MDRTGSVDSVYLFICRLEASEQSCKWIILSNSKCIKLNYGNVTHTQ